MVDPWVLVHSPFVGPVTWEAVAAALRSQGVEAPAWCEWWGADTVAMLVDPVLRHRLEAECWRVPASLFDEVVPVPATWPDAPCAYVSSTYAAEADEAAARGWPVRRRAGGGHLDVMVVPGALAALMLDAAAEAGIGASSVSG